MDRFFVNVLSLGSENIWPFIFAGLLFAFAVVCWFSGPFSKKERSREDEVCAILGLVIAVVAFASGLWYWHVKDNVPIPSREAGIFYQGGRATQLVAGKYTVRLWKEEGVKFEPLGPHQISNAEYDDSGSKETIEALTLTSKDGHVLHLVYALYFQVPNGEVAFNLHQASGKDWEKVLKHQVEDILTTAAKEYNVGDIRTNSWQQEPSNFEISTWDDIRAMVDHQKGGLVFSQLIYTWY